MFYDFSMSVPFVLFGIALASLYNGATALKTRVWSGFGREVQGTTATRLGAGLVLLGTACLVLIGLIIL